jgi:hypothetical protein
MEQLVTYWSMSRRRLRPILTAVCLTIAPNDRWLTTIPSTKGPAIGDLGQAMKKIALFSHFDNCRLTTTVIKGIPNGFQCRIT